MGAFIARQPNGLLCRHSIVVDCVTHYNLTEAEYIQMRGEYEATEAIQHHLRPFDEVIERFYPHNMTVDEFNKLLLEMGSEKQVNPIDYERDDENGAD